MFYHTASAMKKKTLYILLLIMVWAAFIYNDPIFDIVATLGVTLFILDQLGVFSRDRK